jgi:hypothetical protein
MTQEFIPYEQALALKELGFDEPCFGYYNGQGNYTGEEGKVNSSCNKLGMYGKYCTAPTFSQAFRFFREKYNFKSWVEEHTADTFIYEIRPHILTHYKEGEVYVYTIYEETELACLIKLIEIVKEIFNNK